MKKGRERQGAEGWKRAGEAKGSAEAKTQGDEAKTHGRRESDASADLKNEDGDQDSVKGGS